MRVRTNFSSPSSPSASDRRPGGGATVKRAARLAVLGYGLFCYLLFLVTFTYAIGFVSGIAVPRSLDSGPTAPLGEALLINGGLLTLFVLQHTVMARRRFKRWWTRIVPPPVERSTFVLFTCLILGLLFWQWRPLGDVIWEIHGIAGRATVWTLAAFGWLVVLVSTFIIDHFELFGLSQVLRFARGRSLPRPEFKVSGLYRYVRHPLMLGFIIAFWATPRMTLGHLLFAAGTTLYILAAIRIEERDLVATHGEDYRRYRRRVPALVPWRWAGSRDATTAEPSSRPA